jgi:hypothetical protein
MKIPKYDIVYRVYAKRKILMRSEFGFCGLDEDQNVAYLADVEQLHKRNPVAMTVIK